MRFFPSLLLCGFCLFGSLSSAQTVRFETSLGNLDVQLLPNAAPLTVQNFLNYVNKGAYNNSFFHRSATSPQVLQGGGYKWVSGAAQAIAQDAPVRNEYSVPNTEGTLAMAKLGGDPDSATNQWYFNTGNNANILNENNNGGFTVFGRITTSASLTLLRSMAKTQVVDASGLLGAAFTQLPVVNYTSGSQVSESNLVVVRSITVLDQTPSISAGGVISAGAFGALNTAAPGSFIEIYGTNLAGGSGRFWTESDFSNGRAPASLDGVSVSIDGKSAFVYYISPTQINVQVPGDVTVGSSVPVVVTWNGRASAPVNLSIVPIAAGILAPPSFRVGEKQYVAALHSNGSFVNAAAPNVPSAPAAPGETIIIYGIGFGDITSGTVAGQIAQGTSSLATPVQFLFGDQSARVEYAGLAPGYVGLYQFNVVVPDQVASGDVPLRVISGTTPIAQTELYIPVRRP